jgi:hypothetical protein
LAADLYLDVVAITGQPDHPKLGGSGAAIEYAVKMTQFPAGFMLSERAERGELSSNEIDQVVTIVADFHDSIATASVSSPYGEPDNIKHWFVENFDHIRPLLIDDRHNQQLDVIEAWGNDEWHKKSVLMQQRKQQGYIRECHGDLHLGNMTLINGNVTVFDCIEFNPMLRWIDVISEVAFLFMDLQHCGYDHYAHRFINQYLQRTGDYQSLALFRYYLVYRALVRAKVSLLRLSQLATDAAACKQARSEYTEYVNLAERFINYKQPVLIITHGFSGSGKSTFANQLADHIGALQIRSDIERKRLFGCPTQNPSGSGIDTGLYTQDAGVKTYQRLIELAKATLDAGFSAIIDATFLKFEQRNQFCQLAADKGIKFFIIDCQASHAELTSRLLQRQHDASEATIEVLYRQQKTAQPLRPEEQQFVINVDSSKTPLHSWLDESLLGIIKRLTTNENH